MPSYRERVGRHGGQSPGRVRIAEDDDLEQIAEIETRADEVFSVDVVAQLPATKNNPESLRAAAVVLVAGRPAVGFARVDVVEGLAHLEQLSVLPEDTRMGIGGELVEAACRWAADQGLRAITLITFADVPWNAPFYAARGFREIDELTPGLAELRDWERDLGLDRVGRRVVMRRDLGAPPPEPGAGSPVVAGFAPVPRSPAHLSAT
jgi:ribosomal protein S18 acetylase RimI-like enzyme